MNIEDNYKYHCDTPSDINEHLPTLKQYSEYCNHVTEFGVRGIVSTYALLMGKPRTMTSYDINNVPWEVIANSVKKDTDFKFFIGNTLEIEIEPTELLFIDTLHNYDQLSEELRLHADKVSKYIILHDTVTYGQHGESYTGEKKRGLQLALGEFLSNSKDWYVEDHYTNNNGLTILARN